MNASDLAGQVRLNWKKVLINFGLIALSSAIALVLCELGARVALNPIDYLSPVMVRDGILGIRLPPRSGGHDRWGFRNTRVPETAEIVALGDSHTYGNAAKMNEAWPQVLGHLTGKSIYNLGMGGYGPNQYYYLLQTKGLALRPKTVVCGLYLGDDFDNAFRITYGLDYWSFLRNTNNGTVDPDIWEKQGGEEPGLQKRLRVWLSEHSIVYKLVFHNVLQGVKGRIQIENAVRMYQDTTALILPDKHIREAFRPKAILRGLDQQSRSVQEGMRLTIEILERMNSLCSSNQVEFIVAVIPTKEEVFSRYLEHNPSIAMGGCLDQVIANSRKARQILFAALQEKGIRNVDLLPTMQQASELHEIYTPTATDMHPNKNGYQAIAEGIARYLNSPLHAGR